MKTIERRPGVVLDDAEARIWLWAPHAESVSIELTDSSKQLPLAKEQFGYWQLTTDQLTDGTRYQFNLDGTPLPDPASLSQPEGVHGASAAVNLQFSWTDNNWQQPELEDYILYELHTGTYTPQGDFSGIETKLDYLASLGINAIEIMPVAQFPGDRNWGYDGVYPYAVQNSYGGAKALQHLVNACHERDIAVVLDVVYNHLGPEGNYFKEYGPYFTDKYNTPWGDAINFDDANCDAVRHYFKENVLMWFRDFHIDALRMDAVHAIKDFSAQHILSAIKTQVEALVTKTGRQHYLIIECDLNDTRFINQQDQGGFGMDAQWVDEFHHALRTAAGGDRTGYYSDFNGIEDLAKAYNDAYVYDGQYSTHRQKHFGIKATHNLGKQFVVFSQNHDQVGNRMLGERSSELFSFEMQKLMAGAVFTAPFLPMLFMGEEYGESNRFMYFVSHTDPELAQAVREGRKAEFAAFHAQGEAPDPMAEETYLHSKLQWQLLDQDKHEVMLNFYKNLIALRKRLPALYQLNRKLTNAIADSTQQTLILRRATDTQQVLILMNFSKKIQNIEIDDIQHGWSKLFDSADKRWNGPQASPDTLYSQSSASIQPESFLIYTSL